MERLYSDVGSVAITTRSSMYTTESITASSPASLVNARTALGPATISGFAVEIDDARGRKAGWCCGSVVF